MVGGAVGVGCQAVVGGAVGAGSVVAGSVQVDAGSVVTGTVVTGTVVVVDSMGSETLRKALSFDAPSLADAVETSKLGEWDPLACVVASKIGSANSVASKQTSTLG